ncbi:MAG: DUF1998 domain-containing protein, partial [Desulfobacteraceae bacterium]|nr:DUF1998 domain-containing protein [Desulfobacteraceae bacterium]
VEVKKEDVNYFTRARSSKSTRIMKVLDSKIVNGTRVGFAKLKITDQVTGYDKKLVATQRSLGIIPLDLPQLEFETQGLWIEIPDRIRDRIESELMHFMGGIHALEHAAIGIMPLLVMTDRNDIGGISTPYDAQVGKAAVFIYDGIPGGLGFAKKAFENAQKLMERTWNVIKDCDCETGCPSCVHSPKCGSGNRPIDKASVLKILELLFQGVQDNTFHHINIVQDDPEPSSFLKEKTQMSKVQDIRYGVLDIETRRSAKEVGGWHKAEKMGVSCAILYDSKTDSYNEYMEEDITALINDLQKLDLVIGFNIIRFDYKVLTGISAFDFYSLPTLDLLLKIHEQLGYRLSLDHLAQQTLGLKKSADGLAALQWWKEGKIKKIVVYCKQDVKVTKELYLFGKKNHFLIFQNKAQKQVRVPVNW